ncbi:helix-turn-helix transcriptional regulator [Comamonas testosteroni]
MNQPPATIGERIALARQARGWSQTELGKACGMAPTQVSRYEAGRAVPRRITMARIADVLAIRFQWLVAGTGEMDEFNSEDKERWLTFSISGDLADRLQNYAMKSGLTLAEAMVEILDFPLSGFDAESQEAEVNPKLYQPSPRAKMRIASLRDKVRFHKE